MKKIILILMITLFAISSCTKQSRAKTFGGSYTVELQAGEKLVEATWKEDQLWYLTRQSKEGEIPEILTFQEDSKWGLLEGKVIFKEK